MKELLDVLEIKELNKLVEEGKAIFFNYSGPLSKLPNIPNQDLLTFIKGDGNVLVNKDLYTKNGSCDYRLRIKDWLKTDEAEEYAPLLLKMSHKEALLRYISKCLN